MGVSRYEEAREAYAREKANIVAEEASIQTTACAFLELTSKNAFIEAEKEADLTHEKLIRGLQVLLQEMTLAKQKSLLDKLQKLVLDGKFKYCSLSKKEESLLMQIGKGLLIEGRFADASSFLLVLSLLAPPTEQLWLDLGMAEQKQGDFDTAIIMYSYANHLNISSPIPYLYSAECYIQKMEKEEARQLLNTAFSLIEVNKKRFAYLLLFFDSLQEKLMHINL